ncbi:MAG TPA: DUF4430 domain-containing protein [Clostridia bacterium]|nr:DUF4430 domain-containing protein [Clostridia bacterium]
MKYSIDARKAVDKSTGKSFGMLLPECDVPLQSGDTVYSVLKRICKLKKLALDATTIGEAYVKGIGGAEEFDNGPQSGWIYRLNGVYAASGCSIKLKAGDRVEWIYTTDYGKSEGGTK